MSIKSLITSSINLIKFMFKKLLNPKAWALFLLMLFAIPIVADDFNSQRTDFRDESIYFMMTIVETSGHHEINTFVTKIRSLTVKVVRHNWHGDKHKQE